MTELISPHQAHLLMLAVLILAPLIGLAWGASVKRLVPGVVLGLLIGLGNYALWTIYNAITDSLGLDTVKNLLVNLALFVIIGIVIGIAIALCSRRSASGKKEV